MRALDPRVSYAELARWPEDGRRYELYDGEAIVVPAPNYAHQRVARRVAELLFEYERQTGGAAVFAPFDIVLTDYDVVQPDVVFFGRAKRELVQRLTIACVVPDLAVEVLSRSTERRDRGRKLELLARHGLPEYWLIDPGQRVLEVYVLNSSKALTLAALHTEEQECTSPTLGGLTFKVAGLFEP